MKEKEEDPIPKTDPAEIETLISRIEQSNLGEEEKRLITRLLRTLLTIVAMLQEKKIKLRQLRKLLLFGWRSEKRKKSADEKKNSESDMRGNDSPDAPGTEKNEHPPSDPKPKQPGHGRRPAS